MENQPPSFGRDGLGSAGNVDGWGEHWFVAAEEVTTPGINMPNVSPHSFACCDCKSMAVKSVFFLPKIHCWKRSAKRQSSKILAILDTTASYGKPWLSQKFKVIAHSATLCFQRTPKLAMGVTHGSCCEQDGCQRNDCAAATMLLFLFLPVDSSLVFVFSRISFLSITSTAEDFFFLFLFFITSHMFLCDWNLNSWRMWTPHTQSQKPWSCQCLRDEGWITNLRMCHTKRAREKKGVYVSFCKSCPST